MRSKGVAMETNFDKMSPLLNTLKKLEIIGSSLTEFHQLIHMTFIVDIYECKHYTHKPTTVILAAHACRGLMKSTKVQTLSVI